MKKIGIIAICVLGLNTAHAQKWQFGISGGYGVGLGTNTNLNYKATYNMNTFNVDEQYTNVKNELGKGFNLQANAAYMFNENLGIDLGFSYLMGDKVTVHNDDFRSTEENSTQLNFYRVLPSLLMVTHLNKVNLYMKFGVNLGLGNMEYNSHYVNIQSNYDGHETVKFSGGYNLGTQAALGVDIPLSKKFKLTGEVVYLSGSYAPTFREITKLDVAGVNQLDKYTVSDKQANLVDDFRNTGNNDKNQPSTELKEYYTIGSIGLQLGIKFVID